MTTVDTPAGLALGFVADSIAHVVICFLSLLWAVFCTGIELGERMGA